MKHKKLIIDALKVLYESGDVWEIRMFPGGRGKRTTAGYYDYDHIEKCAQDIAKMESDIAIPAIYNTINPVEPALLARSYNRLNAYAQQTTTDAHILKRKWLPLDIDPERPAGTSSTDEQHEQSIKKAQEVKEWLKAQGWAEPVVGDSGNGAHLLYKIDEPNTPEALELIDRAQKTILQKLNHPDKEGVKIEGWANSARIWKVYGTMTRKGDEVPEMGIHHRRAKLLDVPDKVEVVTTEQLIEIAKLYESKNSASEPAAKKTPKTTTNTNTVGIFDIISWMARYGIKVERVKKESDRTLYILETCPFNADHTGHRESTIIQWKDGKLGFKCHHDSCKEKKWYDVRKLYEPEYNNKKKQGVKKIKTPIPEITESLKFTDNYDLAVQMQKVQPIYFDQSKNYWLWNKKKLFWQLIDKTDILNSIIDKTGSYIIESKTKNEIIEAIGMTGRKRKVEEVKKSWIYCKNGVYDTVSNKIFPPTCDFFFTDPVPHNIGMSEDTPTIDRLFHDWMGDKSQILYEICAYCLLNDYPIHRMFWLFGGSGRNGKDQFLEFLQRLVGMNNAIATDLEILLTSRFESSKLYRKKLAVISETEFKVIKNTGLLKGLTGHSYIRGEFKGKDGFDFYNTAKIVIATNGLPETSDKSQAFFARCITLEFKNRFAGKQFNKSIIDTIPKVEYENLIYKIFNRVLPELLENGEFFEEGDEDEKKETYERISNPFLIFKERELMESKGKKTPVWVLRELYNIFTEKNNYRKMGIKEFTQTLIKDGIETRREYINNHRWNIAIGIEPKSIVVYDENGKICKKKEEIDTKRKTNVVHEGSKSVIGDDLDDLDDVPLLHPYTHSILSGKKGVTSSIEATDSVYKSSKKTTPSHVVQTHFLEKAVKFLKKRYDKLFSKTPENYKTLQEIKETMKKALFVEFEELDDMSIQRLVDDYCKYRGWG